MLVVGNQKGGWGLVSQCWLPCLLSSTHAAGHVPSLSLGFFVCWTRFVFSLFKQLLSFNHVQGSLVALQ